jgi:2-polyprenyl-6-methoxyphenol hydroxylase-like FAD-dependent oxidoreductase
VIVLGGGPVGLGAALELARSGVASVLVEKHETTSWHPKTRNLNTRTMEIARGWGSEAYKRLRSIDTPPGWKSPIRFLESATGREFGKIESRGFEGPGPDVSPALPVMSSQDLIEEIMLDAVRASGFVDVRFGTEATRLIAGGGAQDGEAVLEVRDRKTGVVERISGAALVAADGADSMIRTALGLELEGPKDLYHVVNCYFRANIERHIGERKGVLLFVSNPTAAGVLQPLDGAGRWLCQITVTPEDWTLDVFTKARAREWVRAASGIASLDVEVLSLGLWKLNATVVERMVQGRIVICGDAAHQFPPTGGLGVNTGLQGMHNAIWKLALFVKRQAGWPLVESYDTERRGLSRSIVRQSLQNSVNVARINAAAIAGGDSGLSTEEIVVASRRYGNHLGVEFGACYASPAVIPDGTTPPEVPDSYSDYVPTATPGCRAPHLWLGRGDAALSTLDLVGAGFTLLAAPDGKRWGSLAREAERMSGVRIDCYLIGSAGLQDSGRFPDVYGVSTEGAVLIRPDGYVAWRCRTQPDGDGAVLAVLKQILAWPGDGAA